ncbi:hypothetical protein LCGC14_2577210, partial [marine sediment metagenome]
IYSESDTDIGTAFSNAMNSAQVDCVIELGDFLETSGDGDPQTDLNTIEDLYDNSTAPRYHVIGNWDMADPAWVNAADYFDQIENGLAGDVSTIDEFGDPCDTDSFFNAGSESAQDISRYYAFNFADGTKGIVLDLTGKTTPTNEYRSGQSGKRIIMPPLQAAWLEAYLDGNTGVPIVVFVHQWLYPAVAADETNAAVIRALLESNGNVVAVFQGDIHPGDGGFWQDGPTRTEYDQGLQPAPGGGSPLVNGIRYYHLRAVVCGWGAGIASTANQVDPCDYDTWTEATPANAYYIAHIGRNLGDDGKYWIHVHGYGTNPGGASDSRHMLARWKLDDAAGQTTIESTNGNNDGVSDNNVNRGSSAPPNYESSMLFNGTSDQVEATSVILDGYPFSVSAWFNALNVSATDKNIFSVGDVGVLGQNFGMRLDQNGKAEMWSRNGGAQDPLTSTLTYDDGKWRHMVAVWAFATSKELY